MQHLLSQNKQLLSHVQELTAQLQKLQELQQSIQDKMSPQNSNSNNNIRPLVISDNSETSSSSKTDSPDIHITDQLRAEDSPQATNPLFEFPSDEMTMESRLLPGDPFLVDPFNSSIGVTVDTTSGGSS